MTIQATSRRAGPFLGNGVAAVFSFAFRIWAAPTLVVQTADNDAVSTGLATLTQGVHYSVTLNPDQATNPGGSITLVAPLAVGKVLAITSQLAIEQTTDITNQGSFFPDVLEGAIDRNTALIQQLAEQLERAVIVASTSTTTPAEVAADLFDASATVAAAVSTAQAAATSASNSATGANASAAAADAARVEAVASYNAAADYATSASNYANIASGRATAAATSATSADTARNEAAMHASNANASETAAANSATTAIGQVAAAANSATASANSATASATSATTAQGHATAAAQSAADAAAAAGGAGGGGGDDNLFFNPSGAVHQRVADGVLTTDGTAWPCDGVQFVSGNQATVKFKASVVASSGPVARTAIRVEATGQNWNVSQTYLRLAIEGADAARMRWGVANSQPVTISFYVRATYAAFLTFGLRSWAAGGTYSTFMTRKSVTTDWTRVSLTVQPQPGANASDWPSTPGSTGFAVLLWLRPYTGAMNMEQWTSGNASTLDTIVGQGDNLGDVGSWIEFQGIKVQLGNLTPFSEPKFSDSLEKAKRYFQKSYAYATAPGAAIGGNSPDSIVAMTAGTGLQPFLNIRFAPALAGNATLVLYNPQSGVSGVTAFRNQAKGDNSTTYSGSGSPSAWSVRPTMTASTAVGDSIAVSWTAAYTL